MSEAIVRLSGTRVSLPDGRAGVRLEIGGTEICTLPLELLKEEVLEGLVRAYLLGSASQALYAAVLAAAAEEGKESGYVQ